MQNLSHEYHPRGAPSSPLEHHPKSNQPNNIQQYEEEDSDDEISTNNKPGKRSGRRKIKIEYIEDKSRRHISFSKRKAGIMKKAYELSTLTGTQVLLLVVSETGLVYTFTTPKLQPLVTKPEGKNLIQSCLNAPDTHEIAMDCNTTQHPVHSSMSPKPNHSSTASMVKSEEYSNGLVHRQHDSNSMYAHQSQTSKVPLSHSSNYEPLISNNYPHNSNFRQDVANHPQHHQQYSSPPTPYPSYTDVHQQYSLTHLPSY